MMPSLPFSRPRDNREFQTKLAAQLLYSTGKWRYRRVEQIEPLSDDAYESQISLQLVITADQIREAGGPRRNQPVPVVVPVLGLPKRLLMDFSITCAGKPLSLLTRYESGAITQRFLQEWGLRRYLTVA